MDVIVHHENRPCSPSGNIVSGYHAVGSASGGQRDQSCLRSVSLRNPAALQFGLIIKQPRLKNGGGSDKLEQRGHALRVSRLCVLAQSRALNSATRADAFGILRTEGSAVTSPPALTTTRGYAQWLTAA